MSKLKNKRILQISLIMLSVIFIITGVMRKEVLDVISNAKIICFSCIGLK